MDASGTEHRVLVSAEVIELHWEPSALFMFRDVTQARTLEAQLRQAQKWNPSAVWPGAWLMTSTTC